MEGTKNVPNENEECSCLTWTLGQIDSCKKAIKLKRRKTYDTVQWSRPKCNN